MHTYARILIGLGGLFIAGGNFLPWFTRNGVSVLGVEGPAWGNPAFVLIVLGGVLALTALANRPPRGWLFSTCLGLATLLVVACFWRAIKLEAIGLGMWLMVAGVVMTAVGLIGFRR